MLNLNIEGPINAGHDDTLFEYLKYSIGFSAIGLSVAERELAQKLLTIIEVPKAISDVVVDAIRQNPHNCDLLMETFARDNKAYYQGKKFDAAQTIEFFRINQCLLRCAALHKVVQDAQSGSATLRDIELFMKENEKDLPQSLSPLSVALLQGHVALAVQWMEHSSQELITIKDKFLPEIFRQFIDLIQNKYKKYSRTSPKEKTSIRIRTLFWLCLTQNDHVCLQRLLAAMHAPSEKLIACTALWEVFAVDGWDRENYFKYFIDIMLSSVSFNIIFSALDKALASVIFHHVPGAQILTRLHTRIDELNEEAITRDEDRLYLAARKGEIDAMRGLFEKGVVHTTDEDCETFLEMLVKHCKPEVIDCVLAEWEDRGLLLTNFFEKSQIITHAVKVADLKRVKVLLTYLQKEKTAAAFLASPLHEIFWKEVSRGSAFTKDISWLLKTLSCQPRAKKEYYGFLVLQTIAESGGPALTEQWVEFLEQHIKTNKIIDYIRKNANSNKQLQAVRKKLEAAHAQKKSEQTEQRKQKLSNNSDLISKMQPAQKTLSPQEIQPLATLQSQCEQVNALIATARSKQDRTLEQYIHALRAARRSLLLEIDDAKNGVSSTPNEAPFRRAKNELESALSRAEENNAALIAVNAKAQTERERDSVMAGLQARGAQLKALQEKIVVCQSLAEDNAILARLSYIQTSLQRETDVLDSLWAKSDTLPLSVVHNMSDLSKETFDLTQIEEKLTCPMETLSQNLAQLTIAPVIPESKAEPEINLQRACVALERKKPHPHTLVALERKKPPSHTLKTFDEFSPYSNETKIRALLLLIARRSDACLGGQSIRNAIYHGTISATQVLHFNFEALHNFEKGWKNQPMNDITQQFFALVGRHNEEDYVRDAEIIKAHLLTLRSYNTPLKIQDACNDEMFLSEIIFCFAQIDALLKHILQACNHPRLHSFAQCDDGGADNQLEYFAQKVMRELRELKLDIKKLRALAVKIRHNKKGAEDAVIDSLLESISTMLSQEDVMVVRVPIDFKRPAPVLARGRVSAPAASLRFTLNPNAAPFILRPSNKECL